MRSDPKSENIVAFHELHARHMHELGDEESAARAAKRADRAREDTRPTDDAQQKRLHDARIGTRDGTDLGATRSPDPEPPTKATQPSRASGRIQVQRAQAGVQRAKGADEAEKLADRHDEIADARERIADELDRRFGERDEIAQELERTAKDLEDTETTGR